MEELLTILFVTLLIILVTIPVVILVQLSSLKQSMKNLEQESKRVLSLLDRLKGSFTPAAPQPQRSEAEKQGAEDRVQESGVKDPSSSAAPSPQASEELQQQPKAAGVPALNKKTPAETATAAPKPPPLPPKLKSASLEVDAVDRGRQKSAPVPLPVQSKAKPSAIEKKPVPKSKFAESVRDIAGKIWRWLLVGEEYQPKNMTTESAIASTWMMRVGIIFITALAAYFLKWSMDKELIGPAGRFAIGVVFGIAMLIGGIKLIKTRYKIIGQGLLGGGIVVLYLCIYAADVMYHLMPSPLAFGLMVVITVTAGFLAIKLDSMLVAIFGIIGGYLTPLALSTTVLSLPGFYSYILILSIAVLLIALVKQWRLLNYLGFILTYGLYFLHSMEHYDKTTDFTVAITFLTLLFVVQSLTVCIHNIFRKQQSTMIEAIHLILNALIYSAGGYYLIIEAHGRPWPSIMSLGLALFYMLYIVLFLKRGLKDRLLLLCLISLAAAYTAWTLPLVLEKESLTIALALLAFIFLWLGRKVKSNFLQSLSYLVYAITFFRIAAMDMPGSYSLSVPENATWSEYFKGMYDRLFTFGISIGSIVGAFLLSRHETKESSIIFPENDINAAVPAKTCRSILFWASVVFIFAFLNLELNTMFRCWDPIRLPMLTLLWGGLALFIFTRMLYTEREGGASTILKGLTCIILGIALIKLIFIDTRSWHLTMNFIYYKDYAALDAFMRLFDFGVMLAVILLIWKLISRSRAHASSSTPFGYTALALFFLFCTLELRTLLYWKMESFMPPGISILWAIFAVSFIIFGISKNKGSLRATGLVLFTVVCGKVVLFDLHNLAIIYRIIALLVVGIALLLGSFAYLKSDTGSAGTQRDKLANDEQ